MELVSRIKSILVSPKTEWQTIEAENAPHAKVFTSYVVSAVLSFVLAAMLLVN